MQYLNTPAVPTAAERQAQRLETANLIFKELAAAELNVFGDGDYLATFVMLPRKGLAFLPHRKGAIPIPLSVSARGRERVLPGFYGTYSEQRLMRFLGAYVLEGRPVLYDVLAKALITESDRLATGINSHYRRIIDQFRFTRAFVATAVKSGRVGAVA